MKKVRNTLLLLLPAVLLTAAVWFGNTAIETDLYPYADPALPAAFDGFRIVQLSDLHGRQFGEGNERLIRAVSAQAPDLIVLTGDFVDAGSDVYDIIPLMEGLLPLAPVYYVTGNHEWGSGQAQTVVGALRKLGVTCLENSFSVVERGEEHILLAGIHDPNGFADQKTPEQLAEEVYAYEEHPFWLLLAHRNSLFNGRYCALGANLTFCGHAHGGVWRLPGTDGLIDTQMQLFPSFTSGFYTCDDGGHTPSTVFVSRGLGNSPHWLPRLLNRPQVAVIILRRE